MNQQLRNDAEVIIKEAIAAVLPDAAVIRALENKEFSGRVFLVSVGKAAWNMANAAYGVLGNRITDGIIITKYQHNLGSIGNFTCLEAGHPVPDENSFSATQQVLELVQDLKKEDAVLFLLSGGGSALFEKPLISPDELQSITRQLLSCGADITQINTIRKRLSAVKGGRFAQHCSPAQVYTVVLSDIIGDPLDMIASGPAYPDSSTCEDALAIAKQFDLQMSATAWELMEQETPKTLDNVETIVTGSVTQLCKAAAESCARLGYDACILNDHMDCEARDAGVYLAGIVREHSDKHRNLAFIAGGETVVHLTGNGLGGRNQELALAAATGISGLKNAAVFSVGSDGTDGPTDAAGGYVDGDTVTELNLRQIQVRDVLENNDAYHALKAVNGLIITGPTGTNVNDVAVALIKA